jgi:hypothetical protein
MASSAAKNKSSHKSGRPASAADRIRTPSVKPTNGITRAQIRKVVDAVISKRESRQPAQQG